MKKLLSLAVFFGLLSSVGHFYLAKRTYQLESGDAPVSRVCNIGEHINCDSALLSPYSKMFGVSLSNFGLTFNLILSLLLICFFIFGASSYWKNITVYLAGFLTLSSIAMALISVTNHLYCPICWGLYACSFIIFTILVVSFRTDLSKPVSFIKQVAKQKSFYVGGGSLILISLLFHINFVNTFDIKNQQEMLDAVFFDWQNETPIQIQPHYILKKGSKDSKITIVEFADLLCPMCKKVHPAVANFLKLFPDVTFHLYFYPLDGSCNPAVRFSRSGLSCDLSKVIICANEQGQGWKALDFIFEQQRQFSANQADQKKIKDLLEKLQTQLEINKQKFELCLKHPSTLKKLKQSALAVEKNAIHGTPSFFVNGKKARHSSHKLLLLRKIYKNLKNNAD